MKKHHLFLLCTAIFTPLFYEQSIGVNLSIFALALLALNVYSQTGKPKDKVYYILVSSTFLSCIAFAWYGDFVSFLALSFSLIIIQFKSQNPELKILLSMPIGFINQFSSIFRMFMVDKWLPKQEISKDLAKKIVAYVLFPIIMLGLFFIVYSFGSEIFWKLFTYYTLDLNLDMIQIFLLSLLGFYISFSFFNYWIPQYFYEANEKLNNNFTSEAKNEHKPTFSFLDLDFERKSGEITLILLNLMLIVFVITYNYEQFFSLNTAKNLSVATHERVNSVIISIFMAVAVMMFYFKGGFNFDTKATNLKLLSKFWIGLNVLLIASTIVKNIEYILYFGLTYKRLGVFAFVSLCIIGLVVTFLKIQNKKTNAYLFNQMFWYCYATILLCSFVNWGGIISSYNISKNKGDNYAYLRYSLDYNEEIILNNIKCFSEIQNKKEVIENIKNSIKNKQEKKFLSKALYYESIDFAKP